MGYAPITLIIQKGVLYMIEGIYKITNIENNKVYIGKAKDIKTRWSVHKHQLRNNKHHNLYLQNAWNKYGENSFSFDIIEECDENSLCSREKFWIDYYNSFSSRECGYNLTDGGEGGALSQESIEKLSKSQRFLGSKFTYDDVVKIKMATLCLIDRKELNEIFEDKGSNNIKAICIGKNMPHVLPELNDELYNLRQTMISQREEIILKSFDEGMKMSQIVKSVGFTTSIVEKCICKYRNAYKNNKNKSVEVYENVLKLKEDGFDVKYIYKKLNIPYNTCRNYFNGINNPKKELPFVKIPVDKYTNIIELYNSGITLKDIARQFNVSVTTIRSIVEADLYANTEVS